MLACLHHLQYLTYWLQLCHNKAVLFCVVVCRTCQTYLGLATEVMVSPFREDGEQSKVAVLLEKSTFQEGLAQRRLSFHIDHNGTVTEV
jgi:hypothetical protein